jgi:ADP-ribosylglycohydrolase
VMGCWLGKAIGGTLGMPFEGQPGPLDLTFYSPVPTEMLPNDDLDLQIVWACMLDKMDDVRVDRHVLSQAWLDHVQFPWDEYGVALRNLRNGLQAPFSGSHDNWFTDSMGAPIRSEIWACLAPGNPELAAAYAYEDACVDHGGEGIWGEVFFSALQSAAFAETDTYILLRNALSLLPDNSRTRRAVEDTIRWWSKSGDWKSVRSHILLTHGRDNFTDAPMNVAFTILGWLAGEGDFARSICIAVNCGMDTDCTGATLGALIGILEPDSIPDRWTAPIGRSVVLSQGIVGLDAPDSLDAFTDMVARLRERLSEKRPDECDCGKSMNARPVAVAIGHVEQIPPIDDAPQLVAPTFSILPGTVAEIPVEHFKKDVLLARYEFELIDSRDVRIMFNTPEECRVWVDGKFAFGREEGVMAPSFHRAPKDQYIDLRLSSGRHVLTSAIRRPRTRPSAEWVVGVADKATMQWIREGFCSTPGY